MYKYKLKQAKKMRDDDVVIKAWSFPSAGISKDLIAKHTRSIAFTNEVKHANGGNAFILA